MASIDIERTALRPGWTRRLTVRQLRIASDGATVTCSEMLGGPAPSGGGPLGGPA